MGARRNGEARLDRRQLAALRESRGRGYLHLPYRDIGESSDDAVFGPLTDAWERAANAAGAATIVVASYADSGLAGVTYSAVKSRSRLKPDAFEARAIAELEKLVWPLHGAIMGDHDVPLQLWWFTE